MNDTKCYFAKQLGTRVGFYTAQYHHDEIFDTAGRVRPGFVMLTHDEYSAARKIQEQALELRIDLVTDKVIGIHPVETLQQTSIAQREYMHGTVIPKLVERIGSKVLDGEDRTLLKELQQYLTRTI